MADAAMTREELDEFEAAREQIRALPNAEERVFGLATLFGRKVDKLLAKARRCIELEEKLESGCNCDPLAQTGGGHRGDCPAFQPECTCYEMTGGHQPGCYFHAQKREPAKLGEGPSDEELKRIDYAAMIERSERPDDPFVSQVEAYRRRALYNAGRSSRDAELAEAERVREERDHYREKYLEQRAELAAKEARIREITEQADRYEQRIARLRDHLGQKWHDGSRFMIRAALKEDDASAREQQKQ